MKAANIQDLTSITTNFQSDDIVLGIDEAGRGPVLGPMVYACAYWALPNNDLIKKHFKFADSKQLKEQVREKIFKEVMQYGNLVKYHTKVIHPLELSRKMLKRNKISLNKISTDAACDLIQTALNDCVNVKEVYVDTVGPPKKYQELLEKKFPGIVFTVTAKADSLFPVVSAASIVAKVTRDHAIENWKYIENNECSLFSESTGSGYPADPYTKSWLKNNYDPVFGFPSLARFSWKTTTNFLKGNAIKVQFENCDEDENTAGKVYKGEGNEYSAFKTRKVDKKVKEYNFFEEYGLTLNKIKI